MMLLSRRLVITVMLCSQISTSANTTLTRDGETAVIDFIDKQYGGTNLTIGPTIDGMSDADILRLYNDIVLEQQRLIAESRPTEMQVGLPQIGVHQHYKELLTHSQTLCCELTTGKSGQ